MVTDLIFAKVYHATCHAEAVAASVTSRLRDQTSSGSKASSRSRSGTPERGGTPPAVTSSPNRKRKSPSLEDDRLSLGNQLVKLESTDPYFGEPPSKRARAFSPLVPTM
jgi:hypothetical protein